MRPGHITGSIDKKSITEKKKNREEKYKRARTSVGQEKGEFSERVSIIGTTNLKKNTKESISPWHHWREYTKQYSKYCT